MSSNITVNGKSLEEHVSAEAGREIAEVRETEMPRIPRHIATRRKANTSGARTMPGIVVYQAGQRETHVIVAGSLFDWILKAPYVRSGHSILGALEHDARSGEVKCHECGAWCKAIGAHVSAMSHPITMREYRIKHGFRLARSPLSSPLTFAKRSASSKRDLIRGLLHRGPVIGRQVVKSTKAAVMRRRALGIPARAETSNLRGECMAQRLQLLRKYTKELGRTPTRAELNIYELDGRKPLYYTSLTHLFQVPMRKILIQAGLQPRTKRGPLRTT